MPLSAGSKLGPYEIVAPLGAGGMGEVYRARDTRLGREVALKILPPAFSNDDSRRVRFEQEARAAAALNHPNIVAVFDIGSEEGGAYIVSELVAGETLEALLERDALPMKKLLDIAGQVADGMAAAHAARIVHRDLKPANIMIAPDGRAKILDFGLAKQSPIAAETGQTVTMHQTTPGMIVGTVNFMSPEQARGREVDYRSDQFSFGLILYRMAAGKPAFDKPETVQILSAILTDDPEPLDSKIPEPLRWAIERCLAKDPGDRYESTRDLFRDLRRLREYLSESAASSAGIPAVAAAAASAAPVKRTRRAAWWIPSVALVCAAAIFALRPTPGGSDQSVYRFTPFAFESGGQCCQQWAPDGKSVAYSAADPAGIYQIMLRRLDAPVPVQLTHEPRGKCVALGWAADGKHILFTRGSAEVRSIAAVGGDSETAFTAPKSSARALAFSPGAGALAEFSPGDDKRWSLWISSPPGAPAKKYSPDPFATRTTYNLPQLGFSWDGKQILLALTGDSRRDEIWLMPYPPDPSHPPRRVMQTLAAAGNPQFDWMPDNRHVILSSTHGDDASQLWIADTRSEDRRQLTSGTEGRVAPAVSPDGSRLIFMETTGSRDIVSIDVATAAVTPFLTTSRNESMPAWAADKPVMAYVTDRNGPSEIWLRGPADSDRPLVSPDSPEKWLIGPAPSPDGARLIYAMADPRHGGGNLWIAAASGGAPIRLTNDASTTEWPGSWSPDGAWFVYLAIRDGKPALMKVKTSGEAPPAALRDGISGAITPAWSPDGQWIAYVDHGEKLISPDGAMVRELGTHRSTALGFSGDSKALYGIRSENFHVPFFSIDLKTGAEKIVGDAGASNAPRSNLNPAIRLSLTPDGKSFVYCTSTLKENLWMFSGFAGPR